MICIICHKEIVNDISISYFYDVQYLTMYKKPTCFYSGLAHTFLQILTLLLTKQCSMLNLANHTLNAHVQVAYFFYLVNQNEMSYCFVIVLVLLFTPILFDFFSSIFWVCAFDLFNYERYRVCCMSVDQLAVWMKS